jgi:hypothetical protein
LIRCHNLANVKRWIGFEWSFIKSDTRHHSNSRTAQRLQTLQEQVMNQSDEIRKLRYRINGLMDTDAASTPKSVTFVRSRQDDRSEGK